MLNKMRYFLKKRGFVIRDLAPITFIDTINDKSSSDAGVSLFSWVLIALVCAGVIFAIVKIVKISKMKKLAQN